MNCRCLLPQIPPRPAGDRESVDEATAEEARHDRAAIPPEPDPAMARAGDPAAEWALARIVRRRTRAMLLQLAPTAVSAARSLPGQPTSACPAGRPP